MGNDGRTMPRRRRKRQKAQAGKEEDRNVYPLVELPPAITVGPHLITVVRKSHPKGDDGEHLYGYFQHSTLEICVSTACHPTLQLETFYHECVEAWNYFYEWHLDHAVIQQMGVALATLAVSNSSPGASVGRTQEESHLLQGLLGLKVDRVPSGQTDGV